MICLFTTSTLFLFFLTKQIYIRLHAILIYFLIAQPTLTFYMCYKFTWHYFWASREHLCRNSRDMSLISAVAEHTSPLRTPYLTIRALCAWPSCLCPCHAAKIVSDLPRSLLEQPQLPTCLAAVVDICRCFYRFQQPSNPAVLSLFGNRNRHTFSAYSLAYTLYVKYPC